MKKLLISFLTSVCFLAGCGTNTSSTPSAPAETTGSVEEVIPLKILAPGGAPAISQIGAIEKGYDVEITDGPDKLQAEFINADSSYDIIVAPTNLGVKLKEANKTNYKLLSIITWGNLYLVGPENADLESANIACFGEQAVTGLVFKAVFPSLADKVNWGYNSVQEAQAALLSGQADVALLAEPVASATIAKAKEQGKDFVILNDLQKMWSADEKGYPQAGIFVKEDVYEENTDAINAYLSFISSAISSFEGDKAVLTHAIDAIGAENLSVPNSNLVSNVYDRLNIHLVKASEVKDELESFLKLFGMNSVASSIIE